MHFMDGWGTLWEGKGTLWESKGTLFEDKCMYVLYERVRERKGKQ